MVQNLVGLQEFCDFGHLLIFVYIVANNACVELHCFGKFTCLLLADGWLCITTF